MSAIPLHSKFQTKLKRLNSFSDILYGYLLWAIVAALYLFLAWSKGVWNTHDSAVMWWLSVDAAIPELTANWLLYGGNFLDGWNPFDRGPLQPLLLILTGAIWMGPEVSYAIGVMINSFWVFGLFYLLRTFQISLVRIITTVFAVALVGPIWINNVYPWPKLLAAGLSLMAFSMFFKSRTALSITFMALALLAHGSSIFAFVALIPFLIYKYRSPKFSIYFLALIPAFLWNYLGVLNPQFGPMRLTQWHFAGTDIVEEDTRNSLVSIISQYFNSGFDTVGYKFNNFLATIGLLDPLPASGTPNWWTGSFLDKWRASQLMSVVLAPGVLLLGFFKAKKGNVIIWLIVLSLFFSYILLEWGGHVFATSWLHTSPLSLLLLLSASLALPFRGLIIIPIQLIYFFIVWYPAIPVSS